MNSPLLTSKDNALIRTIRQVALQTRRSPSELAVAEGLRVLEEAASAGCHVEALLALEDFGAEARAGRLLEHFRGRGVKIRHASAALFRGLSDVVSPQGVLALVRVPTLTLDEIRLPVGTPLVLCLCGIQDPGNLGAIARSGRAAGVNLICTTVGTVSVRNPKVIRASAGSIFHTPIVDNLSPSEIKDYCRRNRMTMYQARPAAAKSCWTTDLCKPTALILGNEARGLSMEEWQDAEGIGVPMISGVESLNVAVAGSVLLFEAFRQRYSRNGPQCERTI